MSNTLSRLAANHQVRFALLLALVASVLVVGILARRPKPVDLRRTLAAVEQGLTKKHRTRALHALKQACRRKDCDCARAAAKNGLDIDATSDVLAILTAAKSCGERELDGLRAEVLVRSGSVADGRATAERVLRAAPHDAFALKALALADYRENLLVPARKRAEEALRAGRGDAAELLLGLIAYYADEPKRARASFKAVLKSEPDDLDATFNLALVAQRRGSYGEARSNYLKVVRLDPQNQDARYNLAVLLHSVGATQEAMHNLTKLKALNPDPQRVAALEARLARPPERPPTQVLKLGEPTSASPTPAEVGVVEHAP